MVGDTNRPTKGLGAAESEVLKEHDSLIAVLFAGRAARTLVPLADRLGLTPNQITAASFASSLVAAALIAAAPRSGEAVAALLIAVSFVLDCLDGQLARATHRVSDFGRYLDSLTDLVKVFVLVAALTLSARRSGGDLDVVLGTAAFFGYLLCEYHVQLARQMPQRSQADYERRAAPWKESLRVGGQKIDLAFAIGEVLSVIALAAFFERPREGLAVIAIATPVQFLSYSIRFWRHRYSSARS